MIVGIGIDLVQVERIKGVYARHRERFLKRVLTPAEQAYVLQHADPSERLAGRWAAKEAALKALGTGLASGVRWRDVEILPDEHGKPVLILHGQAAVRARHLEAAVCHVTITHSEGLALAQVILERS
ncbi:MAG: holo-ACP synthase [Planctomycetota bacterium]|nr:holo-ACP synthase [Planctomycetota bacterium]